MDDYYSKDAAGAGAAKAAAIKIKACFELSCQLKPSHIVYAGGEFYGLYCEFHAKDEVDRFNN